MAKLGKGGKEVNPALEDAIKSLLQHVMSDTQASITDKVKVIDRALKLEAIKQKMGEEYGSGLFGDDPEEDEPI